MYSGPVPMPMETDARSEYRRDFPFGISHSLMLHIVAILFLMGTTWYVVTKFPDSPSVRSTVITIETLVRAPAVARTQTQQQQQQLTNARTASSSSASSHSAPAMTPPVARPVADASHPAGSRTEMSVLAKNMPHVPPASSAKFFTRDAAAVPGTNGASASASGGATNDGSTLVGPGPGDGENGRAHTGAVWGEEAPGTFGGRAGRGHDDCTPSRGGWFR